MPTAPKPIAHIRRKRDLIAWRMLRVEAAERDGWLCQDCGQGDTLDIHHIKKRGQGGKDELDNLITLCRVCHAAKHGRKVIL